MERCGKYKKHDWPVDQIRIWIEVENLTHSQVASSLGCAHQTISKICKKNSIKTHRTGPRSGPGHPEWEGGRYLDMDGYYLIYSPNHPHRRKNNTILEHRVVMEYKLGRLLLPDEVVHHIDGCRINNHPDNLELFDTNANHLRHELTGRIPNWGNCKKASTRQRVKQEHESRKESRICDPPNNGLYYQKKILPRISVPLVPSEKDQMPPR